MQCMTCGVFDILHCIATTMLCGCLCWEGLVCPVVLCPGVDIGDWTLGAVAYPSQKSAMSVRRHTKVLADGEG